MFKKLKALTISLASLLVIAAPLAVAPMASAAINTTGGLCSGINGNISSSGNGKCTETGGSTTSLNSMIQKIVNIFSAIVGIIAVIFVILGGLRYITSGGDSGKVGTAKNTIIYALIGLVIVALAQVIVRFVINQSSNVTNVGL